MPFLQSLTSLFTSSSPNAASSSRHAARRSVMNSTSDAFSLPTTNHFGERYTDGTPQPDSAASSPDPSRRGRDVYSSYPPAKDAYRPASNEYPPLSHTYHRIRNSLADTFPELLETINGPVDPSLLASFEAELGCSLPPPVRESFLIADGQDLQATSHIQGSGGLFFGLHLLPLEDVMREWAFWRQAEDDPAAGRNPAVLATMASVPPGWIKSLYACRGWLPLLSDRTGNYIGVDLHPGPGGAWGQVIVFGRDFDRKCVLWRGEGEGGWGKWLASFVDELESGEGWEADKSNSSDEDEEVGYGSYNGGGAYGEAGKGLRLAGEYRGWNVLEAWWDRSVRRWEGLGLGLDVEEVERGLKEARRLAGYDAKGKDKEMQGLGIGMRVGESAAQVEIPGSPNIPPAPSTPVPGDSDILLPPTSPDQPSLPAVPRFRNSYPTVRVITPINSFEHPLGPDSGYLSPPSSSPPRNRSRGPAPTPTALDLPTRADVQAMHAIARAEHSGLRGGWVMNLDAGGRGLRKSMDSEMVDIDLEGGKGEKFGSPRIEAEDLIEAKPSPRLISTRSPSPAELTPRVSSREDVSSIPPSVLAATNALRRPSPIRNQSDAVLRDHERDRDVTRSRSPGRSTRESSVMSMDSHDGLLDTQDAIRRSATPPVASSARASEDGDRPTMRLGGKMKRDETNRIVDGMEDVSLGDGEVNGVDQLGRESKGLGILNAVGLSR